MAKPKQTPHNKVMKAGGKSLQLLIETCINNGIENPKIEIQANVTDGSKYVLKFERIDLDL